MAEKFVLRAAKGSLRSQWSLGEWLERSNSAGGENLNCGADAGTQPDDKISPVIRCMTADL